MISGKLVYNLQRNPALMVAANAGAQSIIRFVSNVILAHLLIPTAFALSSITIIVIAGIQMFSDAGIAIATLRHPDMDDDFQSRMWTMQFVRGIAIALVMLIVAEPVARLYEAPELALVLTTLAIMPVIEGLQSLHPILEMARRNLTPVFWMEVVGRLSGTLLSIIAATITPTVWALVIGTVSQVVTSTALSHILSRKDRPRFIFDFTFMRQHWNFSRWIQLGSTLTFLATQVDKAIFPFLYGFPRFGLYAIAANFALLPAQFTQKWCANVFYPLVVEMMKGTDKDRNTLIRLRITMLLYTAILAAGVMAVAPSFFYLLYKPTYHEAARFAVFLAASFYFETADSSLRHFLLAAGSSTFEFIAVFFRMALFAIFVWLIWYFGGDAEIYAIAFTGAQAGSSLLMLVICVQRRYCTPTADLVIGGLLSLAMIGCFLWPNIHESILWATLICFGGGMLTLAAMAMIFRNRGLPALSREAGHEIQSDIERMETKPAVDGYI